MGGAEKPLGFACVVLAVAAVYFMTLYPSIGGGDSGELVVESHIFGSAHPPGYPLFVMLHGSVARIARALETAVLAGSHHEPAFWMNATSATVAAAGAGFLFLTAITILQPWQSGPKVAPGACCGALLFAFSPLTWWYSIHTEVFALNNFFVALLLYVSTRFFLHRRPSGLTLGAFVVGLGLTNQHTLVLYAGPLVLAALINARHFLTFTRILGLGAAGLLGLSPYVFLYFATLYPSKGSWGDATTWEGFWRHFSRAEYGSLRLYAGKTDAESPLQRTIMHLTDLVNEQLPHPALAALPILGILVFLILDPHGKSYPRSLRLRVITPIIAALFFYETVFHFLSNMPLKTPLLFGVHQRFWMQPNAIIFLFAALALAQLPLLPGVRSIRGSQWFIVAPICLALVGMQLQRNWSKLDHSKDTIFRDFGRIAIGHLPQNSIVVVNGDITVNSIRYQQQVLGLRPDITTIEHMIAAYPWWYRHARTSEYKGLKYPPNVPADKLFFSNGEQGGIILHHFILANSDRPFFACHDFDKMDPTWSVHFDIVPWGLCNRIVSKKHLPMNATLFAEWNQANNLINDDIDKHLVVPFSNTVIAPDPGDWTLHVFHVLVTFRERHISHLYKLATSTMPWSDDLIESAFHKIRNFVLIFNQKSSPYRLAANLMTALTLLQAYTGDIAPFAVRSRIASYGKKAISQPYFAQEPESFIVEMTTKHALLSVQAEEAANAANAANASSTTATATVPSVSWGNWYLWSMFMDHAQEYQFPVPTTASGGGHDAGVRYIRSREYIMRRDGFGEKLLQRALADHKDALLRNASHPDPALFTGVNRALDHVRRFYLESAYFTRGLSPRSIGNLGISYWKMSDRNDTNWKNRHAMRWLSTFAKSKDFERHPDRHNISKYLETNTQFSISQLLFS